MSFTKVQIYNLTLSALLLSEEVIDIDTSKSNNISILNRFYDVALESTLKDLDLDSLSQSVTLELVETLSDDDNWSYVYKYPTNCAFFRRIKSPALVDRKSTHISKKISMKDGQRVIFTNEENAVAEIIPKNIPLEALNAEAGLALSYKLAYLSAPLITGKGAKKIKEDLQARYIVAKLEAQETDSLENFNYEADYERSEFVEARLS